MSFNEDTRVKIPAIITLTRLGYNYISKDRTDIDPETNIFKDIFFESLKKINKNINQQELESLLNQIKFELSNDDLGRQFYNRLINQTNIKLIDFDNIENNTLNVVTELTCKNEDEEFRPDITLLINGIPLCFIEVKKPNNKEGIEAERERINKRFKNEKFRKFINLTQIMVFSNNMSYDENETIKLQGAFYCTSSKTEAFFNPFQEKDETLKNKVNSINEETENFILKDNNHTELKNDNTFIINKNLDTPTNSIILSLFSKERIFDFLKYSIVYVEYTEEKTKKYHLEKHIMRYQQFFASKAIQEKLNQGIKKGIIWHTQGSGKTALAYYNVKWLKDYFSKKNIVPKFYFIVDRIDLRNQANDEFTKRKLHTIIINSKEDFIKNIQEQTSMKNDDGVDEINIVNIQKFSEESKVLNKNDYDTNTQRIYFIDEAHRSYNPNGCFFINLIKSDPKAIMISLTGTPLIDTNSTRIARTKELFGDYIDKYYYNQSISDGYTLRLIREKVEIKYLEELKETLKNLKIQQNSITEKDLHSHKKYITPMLEYIVNDLKNEKIKLNENIGGMIVCNSSDQARKLFELFNEKYKTDNFKAILILYDEGTKEERKQEIDEFKEGNGDILIVYNMLLTGFDCPRLKKLYLDREVRDHNLLQTLTRVNRPYKNLKYGYVVDFIDIQEEFDKTNKAYWDELNEIYGDEINTYYNSLFKSYDEMENEIKEIKEKLWNYDTTNPEIFNNQISQINDKKQLYSIKKLLETVKVLYNIIKLTDNNDLLDKFNFNDFKDLLKVTENRINFITFKESKDNFESIMLFNEAMEDYIFEMIKVDEKELQLVDNLRKIFRKTLKEFEKNYDKKDPQYITLKQELDNLVKNFENITDNNINENIDKLNKYYFLINQINIENNKISHKYENDERYAKIHKELIRENINMTDLQLYNGLIKVKHNLDEKLLNQDLLSNRSFFSNEIDNSIVNSFENINDLSKIDTIKYKIINNY